MNALVTWDFDKQPFPRATEEVCVVEMYILQALVG
jgi:hypothetical protein